MYIHACDLLIFEVILLSCMCVLVVMIYQIFAI